MQFATVKQMAEGPSDPDMLRVPAGSSGDVIDFATASPQTRAALAIELKDLFLSVRTRNVLYVAEIRFVGELVQWTESSVRAFQNCGAKTVAELRDILDAFGLIF